MLFLIHERSARNRANKNMGFDRDEFNNEINANRSIQQIQRTGRRFQIQILQMKSVLILSPSKRI